MARRKRAKPQALSDVLKRVYPAPKQLKSTRVFAWWNRSVAERIVRNARPVSLRGGRLLVHVSSSVWAQELHYLSQDLLDQIQTNAPDAGVKEIRFRVGELPDRIKVDRPPVIEPRIPIELGALPPDLARALGGVRDDALRDTITAAAQAGLSRKTDDD